MPYPWRNLPPLVLASTSPRRKELLTRMGLSFEIDTADVEETADQGGPGDIALHNAILKARAVGTGHLGKWIIAADTVVWQGKTFPKPKNGDDARRMLMALRGRWHEVFTGLCVWDTFRDVMVTRVEVTRVHMRRITDEAIRAYVDTGEPMDKAGAYGIQGLAEIWIDRIEGSYSNVVGLPIAGLNALIEMLEERNASSTQFVQ